MTLIEYMQELDELVQAHPEAARFTVIKGNEDDGYTEVMNEPTIASVVNLDDIPIELEDLDSELLPNVVVIN